MSVLNRKIYAQLRLLHKLEDSDPSLILLRRFAFEWYPARACYYGLRASSSSAACRITCVSDRAERLDGGDSEVQINEHWRNEVILIMDLLKQGNFVDSFLEAFQKKESSTNSISRLITISCGLLYAVVRLVILVLAFAALRRQDERVYVETWTRYLPKAS